MKISTIVWDDAEDESGWLSKEEADKFTEKECLVESVGYVIKKTKKYLTVAGDIIKDKDGDTYGRVFKIPIGQVKSIK